jgi:hypothetical protein
MVEFLTVLAVFISDMLGRVGRWLTFRRVLGIVAFLILLLLVRQLMGIGADLTFIFGLDLGLVTEVSALIILLAVRDHVATVVYVARRALLRLKPVGPFLRHGVRRAFRSRSARPLPPPSDDEPAVWGTLNYAKAS